VTERRDQTLAPLFRRHTRRPRLTSLLDNSKAQAILLTAPAGYGKTTLAQEWLQGRDHVAWYRATSASADLAAFSAGLAEVIAPIVPGAGARIRQRLRVGDAPEKAVRPLAELLAEDLSGWPDNGIIVVDDYHLVTDSTPVEDFVDWVLTLVPVRMLVTTRRRPAWASARRVLYGEIMEISAEQLAMTDEEASRVLEDRPGESVRMLVRQAQGWPALIGLAALSASLDLPEEQVSDALFRYFAEEVLSREPPEVQRFMVLASLPATLDVRVGRDLLGFDEPEPILARLKSENILHDSNGLVFHPLLRDFLQRKLQSDDPEGFADRAQRTIEDARRSRRWDDAIQLSVQIGRDDQAAELVAEAATELLAHGRIETLEKWLNLSAPSSLHNQGTMLAKAELLLHKGRISDAINLASQVAHRLPAESLAAARTYNLTGRALHLLSKEEDAFASFARARALARDLKEVKEALWGLFLSANEIIPQEAVQYLDELESLAADDIDTHLRLAVGRQFAAEQQGTLAGLSARYEALVESVDHATDPLARSSFLANFAAMNVCRGHYELAERVAQQALGLCRELNLEYAVGACLGFLAGAEVGLRKFRRAERTLATFGRTIAYHEDPYFQYLEQILRIKLAASTGRAVGVLASHKQPMRNSSSRRGRGEYLATLAIVAAATGERTAASSLAEEARKGAVSVDAVHGSSIAEAITAVAREGSRQVGRLEETITAAVSADFRDGLVLAYRAWPELFTVVRDPMVLGHLRDSVVLSHDHAIARRCGLEVSSDRSEALVASLTPREVEVLELLVIGLSNAEIAQRLFITRSTTKVHVHHILKKLGVRTRLQAILKARSLLDELETD
jgi:LuxR family transcriptional regulator, maltose regulon positive regulatory protein